MADVYEGPYGTYVTPTAFGTQSRVRMTTTLTYLRDMIPSRTTGIASNYAPDFRLIQPDIADKLRTEINAILAGINSTAVLTATTDLG